MAFKQGCVEFLYFINLSFVSFLLCVPFSPHILFFCGFIKGHFVYEESIHLWSDTREKMPIMHFPHEKKLMCSETLKKLIRIQSLQAAMLLIKGKKKNSADKSNYAHRAMTPERELIGVVEMVNKWWDWDEDESTRGLFEVLLLKISTVAFLFSLHRHRQGGSGGGAGSSVAWTNPWQGSIRPWPVD